MANLCYVNFTSKKKKLAGGSFLNDVEKVETYGS